MRIAEIMGCFGLTGKRKTRISADLLGPLIKTNLTHFGAEAAANVWMCAPANGLYQRCLAEFPRVEKRGGSLRRCSHG